MATANTADFLGGGSMPIAKAKIFAPGEEPNPKNPGGISNNELARRREADRLKQAREHYAKLRAQQSKEIGKRIVAERKAFAKTQPDFWQRAGSDLKVLGPAVLKVVGTGAAIVATGGAAAGAIGLGAGLAGITAAAVTADKVISAVNTGQKVVSSIKKGDVSGLAGAASEGLAQAGVKAPTLPSIAKMGGDAVAGLVNVKLDIPDPKKQLAAAKKAASSAKAAVTAVSKPVAAAVKSASAVPGKVAAPKLAPAKVATTAATNLFKAVKKPLDQAAAARERGAANIAHAREQAKKLTASTTTAASLFRPLATAGAQLTSAIVRPTTGAAATIAIKPPTGSKPPAMTTTRPPAPSPSVSSSIAAPRPSSAPPVIKPPALVASDASSGPTLEGYLVKLDGTIETRRRYRTA